MGLSRGWLLLLLLLLLLPLRLLLLLRLLRWLPWKLLVQLLALRLTVLRACCIGLMIAFRRDVQRVKPFCIEPHRIKRDLRLAGVLAEAPHLGALSNHCFKVIKSTISPALQSVWKGLPGNKVSWERRASCWMVCFS